MKNPKLTLFYLSQSLSNIYFWIAIAIPYLLYRGLTPTQALSLIALYQLFGVIFEYPTGVIGDRFGYRRVTYFSNTLNLIAMLIMLMQGGYLLYLLALFFLALGNGFSSGNDMGILKAISTNVKKDTANYNALMSLIIFISAIIGGFISRFSYELALVISGVVMFSANIPLFLLRDGIKQTKNTQSLATIAKDGIKSLKNKDVRGLFVIAAIFGGFWFAIKSIMGSFDNIYHLNVDTIGMIIGLGGLAGAIGGKLYAEYPVIKSIYVVILIGFSALLVGLFPQYLFSVGLLLFILLLFGYLMSKIDGDIHDLASDHIRASLFSLKRLIIRIIASIYLALYGLALGAGQFTAMMYGTSVVLFIAVMISWSYLNRDKRPQSV